ncbi:MAG: circadian clock protein KaiB [Gammaproteobacteria bacterium]|nr:circadian clock protein KaiB [Gammaproteobacteria bacterium]MBU1443609.1 circadian clock protein KaiB [Gammaproteobacteria bacterium]MBU2288198.1 circadian clock protein KaiB [Gammaproteobacteria bacterium]
MSSSGISVASPQDEPPDADSQHAFRLYVTSASPISSRAVVNIRQFLDTHLSGRHALTVLNIADHIASAQADQVVASPTLIRIAPLPQRRFIGDMSDPVKLAQSLGLRLERRP